LELLRAHSKKHLFPFFGGKREKAKGYSSLDNSGEKKFFNTVLEKKTLGERGKKTLR